MRELFEGERTYIGVKSGDGKEYVCATSAVCDVGNVKPEELRDCCCRVTPANVWWR